MTVFKPFLLLIATACCLSFNAQAQTITQDEFIEQLKRIHPFFEKEKLAVSIEMEERSSFLGAADWNLFSSAGYSHEEPSYAFAGPEKTDAFQISGGIEKVFWKTGGRLSASFNSYLANIEIDPLYGFPNTFYENQIELSYSHPLLKNRNGFLDRHRYELKQFDIDCSEVQALENMEGFVSSCAGKFLDWTYLTEEASIIAERLKLSGEELERVRKKREANLVDQADVIRAEDAVRIWKQNQVLTESRWKALQAELAVLSQNNDIYNLTPEFDLYEIREMMPLGESIAILMSDSRILKNIDIRLKQLEFARAGFENTSRPDLSLIAYANTKNIDESLGNSLGMDKPDAMLGLQLSVPLGNRTAKARIARTDIQILQLSKKKDELALALTSALTNIVIQINEMRSVLDLNRDQIEKSKEKTREELKLYNQGRGELTFVIQSRDSEQNAKLTYAQNALLYHKLILEYQSMMDQLYK